MRWHYKLQPWPGRVLVRSVWLDVDAEGYVVSETPPEVAQVLQGHPSFRRVAPPAPPAPSAPATEAPTSDPVVAFLGDAGVDSLDDLTVSQLKELAGKLGVDLTGRRKKAEIVAAITEV